MDSLILHIRSFSDVKNMHRNDACKFLSGDFWREKGWNWGGIHRDFNPITFCFLTKNMKQIWEKVLNLTRLCMDKYMFIICVFEKLFALFLFLYKFAMGWITSLQNSHVEVLASF